MLAEWQAQRHREGQCKAKSIDDQFGRLQGFFTSVADEDIAALTPREPRSVPGGDGEDIASDWQVAGCGYASARSAAGAVLLPLGDESGICRSDSISRRETGRQGQRREAASFRIEEARRFTSVAVSHFEESEHPLAIGVLLALTMGLRTSEVLDRVARDVDDETATCRSMRARQHMRGGTWKCRK